MLKLYKIGDFMNMINLCFFLLLIIWYLFYLFFILYLFINSNGTYDVEAIDVKRSKRTLEDLSFIIYRKIKPEVLTANIVKLINNGVIKVSSENDDFILTKKSDENLSKSDFSILELLFESIGNGKTVSLNAISKYCDKHSGCSSFLLNYQIWKKMAIVGSNKNLLFEPKLEYRTVKMIQYFGFILFILNIILKINSIFGFIAIIPAIIITRIFYHVSKLTKEASSEYYGFLNFRTELKENEELLNNNRYLEYSIVLCCYDKISNENKINFVRKLDKAIRKCYTNSFFKGNRSIFK